MPSGGHPSWSFDPRHGIEKTQRNAFVQHVSPRLWFTRQIKLSWLASEFHTLLAGATFALAHTSSAAPAVAGSPFPSTDALKKDSNVLEALFGSSSSSALDSWSKSFDKLLLISSVDSSRSWCGCCARALGSRRLVVFLPSGSNCKPRRPSTCVAVDVHSLTSLRCASCTRNASNVSAKRVVRSHQRRGRGVSIRRQRRLVVRHVRIHLRRIAARTIEQLVEIRIHVRRTDVDFFFVRHRTSQGTRTRHRASLLRTRADVSCRRRLARKSAASSSSPRARSDERRRRCASKRRAVRPEHRRRKCATSPVGRFTNWLQDRNTSWWWSNENAGTQQRSDRTGRRPSTSMAEIPSWPCPRTRAIGPSSNRGWNQTCSPIQPPPPKHAPLLPNTK